MFSTLKIAFIAMAASFASGQQVMDIGDENNPDPPFTEPINMWVEDKSNPIEWTVIEITGEKYDELITSRWLSQKKSATPWVLTFVDKEAIDSKRAVVQLTELALFYKGKVRFGYVDLRKNELLAETFSVIGQLPAIYLIKDGMAYNYRLWPYAGDMHDYIEKQGYLMSSFSFRQPGRFF